MRSRKVRPWLDLVNPRLLGTCAIINILMIFANGCSFFLVCFPLVLMIFSHRLLAAVKAFTWEMSMLCYFCGISSSSRAVSPLKSIPCNTRWFVPFVGSGRKPSFHLHLLVFYFVALLLDKLFGLRSNNNVNLLDYIRLLCLTFFLVFGLKDSAGIVMYTRMSQRHIDLQHVRIFIHYFFPFLCCMYTACSIAIRTCSRLSFPSPGLFWRISRRASCFESTHSGSITHHNLLTYLIH